MRFIVVLYALSVMGIAALLFFLGALVNSVIAESPGRNVEIDKCLVKEDLTQGLWPYPKIGVKK